MQKRGLKYDVQNKIILRTVRKNKRNIVFPSVPSIKKIGIVGIVGDVGNLSGFDLNSNNLTKNSELVFLTVKKGKRTKGVEDVNIYTSDLNLWGLPIKRKIDGFINQPFDMLINLSDETSKVLTYVCAASVSKFKISLNSNEKIYDLILPQKEFELLNLFVEIENILNNFNKNT